MTANRASILIADDQPDNLLVLQDLLAESYSVSTASSGQEVLDFVTVQGLPDLLLLDVVMPGLDGFEVCRRLKAQPGSRDIPIIFLTALDDVRDEERGLALGADDFIRKPFVPLVVLARVRNLLSRREDILRQRHMAVVEARLAEQQKAVDRLTVMNTELERFAFVAAHDLREPLRTVISYSQLLEHQCGDRLGPDERQSLNFIVDGCKRMYGLIGGLLAYSHITANMGIPQRTCSANACTLAIENLTAIIRETGAIVIVREGLPEVEADELQLVQVFQNLIGNAVKFHRPGRLPNVRVGARRTPEGWEFSIADDGIGFSPAEQDVFELFRQLRRSDGYGGSGVGLAICKRIIQRLGGRIWAESAIGQGSTFFFTVPAE
jgi:signal transduction histidine kinase